MASKNTLDTKIADYQRYPSQYLETDIGIEVELEGELAPLDAHLIPNYWMSKTDHSLRDGFEYVLHRPLKLDVLKDALDELQYGLSKMKPKTSIRTSTHFHVNVLKQTVRETYRSTFFYYLIEELLMNTQPKERHGNLFCLTMATSTYIHFVLERSLRNKTYFLGFNEDNHKYSAFNLCTVTRFGSLEFRLFQAMYDSVSLTRWATLLVELVRNGAKYDLKELLRMYDEMPVKEFIKMMLPSGKWLWGDMTSDYLNSCLHTNYDRLVDLSRVFGVDVYQVHKALWDDDSEAPSPQQLVYQDSIGLSAYAPDPFDDPYPYDPTIDLDDDD